MRGGASVAMPLDSAEAFLLRPHGERLDDVVDRVGQRERDRLELDPPRLDLGEVEDVVDDGEQRLGLAT